MNLIYIKKNINKRQIHKFGGTSLSDAKCFIMVAGIIAEYSKPGDIMVISAAGKTTNKLIFWLNYRNNKKKIKKIINNYNMKIIEDILLPSEISIIILHLFIKDINNLYLLIKNKKNIKYAEFIGKGEIWSARLMTAILKNLDMQILCINSSNFLYSENITTQQKVNEKISNKLLKIFLKKNGGKRLLVIPGFLSKNELGSIVLLGRNGSDYSATQIGAFSDSKYVTIWSDVSGIYSSDPKIIKKYFLLRLLNFNEANEIARLSIPRLHNRTLQPIYKKKIILLFRCSYNHEKGFTSIENTVAYGIGTKLITSHDSILLMEFFEAHHKNFPYKKKLFTFIDNSNISPLSLKIDIKKNCIKCSYIKEVLIHIFRFLYQYALPAKYYFIKNMQLLAIVGVGVSKNLLQCYRFYKKLKNKSVSFIDKEEGISLIAILIKENIKYIVKSIHKIIFSTNKKIGIIIFGKGNIGSRWIEIFIGEKDSLSNRSSVYFILAGLVNSRRCLCNFKKGLNIINLFTVFEKKAKLINEYYLLKLMQYHIFDDLIVIDVTASDKLAEKYIYFAKYGFHVISANKFAGSVAILSYIMIQETFTKSNSYWLDNATVGAGLPVNHIIRDLRESGDSVLKISGIFSGTLSWLFHKFNGTLPFTNLVEQAWQKGFTEPDPRLDLSGEDVMRKLVILSREAGFHIEKNQVHIESIVPIYLQKCSIMNFFKNSEEINKNMMQLFHSANDIGYVLRHIAKFQANSREAHVGIEAVELNHPIASILPSDNIFIIESVWYSKNPLVIRGPGAGRDVTACAVQSDINFLLKLL